MKKIINLCLLALSFALITSCDRGFDDLNKSKTGATSLDPALVLNNAVISSSFPGGTLTYELPIVQQLFSSNSGVLAGGNYNQINITNTQVIWQNYFQNVIKYTKDVIIRTKDDPKRSNLMNMARIVQANAFIIVTDTYGDIPYTEAGVGYSSQVFFPKYDAQQSIYPNIIQELTDASAALDPAGKIETADALYSGNIAQWKKLGYSLLLRAGMRLGKADAATAKTAVNTAVTGGVITSNSDNSYIKHDANYNNGIGATLNPTEAANFYLAEPFVTALKNNSDPRLPAIAIRYVGAKSGPDQILSGSKANGTSVPSDQYGMPMGSDDAAAQAAAVTLGIGSRYAFSQVDRTRMASKVAPMFLVTAAQSNLLLAEATQTGMITGGSTAVQYFNAGIKAHMDQMAIYNPNSAVAPSDRDTYASARTGVFAGNELQEINYEYWIASFLNGPEAWANFRRSGFPVLAPNPYPGRTVLFITRLTYPSSEILVNSANVQAAIANMGGDNLDTKVWWNK